MNKYDLEERLVAFSVSIIEIAKKENNELISIFVKSVSTAQKNLKNK